MFQPPTSFRQGVDDEKVAVKRKAAEEHAGRPHDAAQVGMQACNVGIGGTGDCHFEARAALAKGVLPMLAHLHRLVDQVVVVSGAEAMASPPERGQSGAEKPTRGWFDLEQAGPLLRAVHEEEQAGAD